jgi:hypothetical protein
MTDDTSTNETPPNAWNDDEAMDIWEACTTHIQTIELFTDRAEAREYVEHLIAESEASEFKEWKPWHSDDNDDGSMVAWGDTEAETIIGSVERKTVYPDCESALEARTNRDGEDGHDE